MENKGGKTNDEKRFFENKRLDTFFFLVKKQKSFMNTIFHLVKKY